MATQVNTVTGPVSSDDIGKTLVHEHFQFGYPGYQGDSTLGPYDPEANIKVGLEVAEKVKAHGVKTVVDATPNECGRDVEVLREISERGGINIVCSTGYYYEGEGAPAYFGFRALLGTGEDDVLEMMLTEINEGINGTGSKAGVIKLATSKDEMTDYEAMLFRCGAKAQAETGVPIITHTQEGTMGPEQAAYLIEQGADPKRVMIGHMDGNSNIAYHLETLSHGVRVSFDRFGIQGIVGAPPDEHRIGTLIGLIGLGYADRLHVSHDTVNVWLGRELVLPDAVAELLKNWHPAHIFENIVPQLKKGGVTEEQIEQILVENPKTLFDA
jgi:phosphotriesterase-related protein